MILFMTAVRLRQLLGVPVKDKCVKCYGDIHVSDGEIERDINRVVESGVPLANDRQYQKRLKVCYSCDQIIDGTTCMICGCIVRVRAMNALRICPHPSGNRW